MYTLPLGIAWIVSEHDRPATQHNLEMAEGCLAVLGIPDLSSDDGLLHQCA